MRAYKEGSCGNCAFHYHAKGMHLCDLNGRRADPRERMCRHGDGSSCPVGCGCRENPQDAADIQYHGCPSDNMRYYG